MYIKNFGTTTKVIDSDKCTRTYLLRKCIETLMLDPQQDDCVPSCPLPYKRPPQMFQFFFYLSIYKTVMLLSIRAKPNCHKEIPYVFFHWS